MKKPFVVGEWVNVYSHHVTAPRAGKVISSDPYTGLLSVHLFVDDRTLQGVHPKCCRRPKPKRKARTVYLTPLGVKAALEKAGGAIVMVTGAPWLDWIEFREVLRKEEKK